MGKTYLVWKALHVIGAVLMVGNVTVTGLWTLVLWQGGRGIPHRQIVRGIFWSDLLFTFGGGALLTIAGIQMVRVSGLPWRETPWLLRGFGALGASIAIWLAGLLPDQARMARCEPHEQEQFRRLFIRWNVMGWGATVALYYGLWNMVTKPA